MKFFIASAVLATLAVVTALTPNRIEATPMPAPAPSPIIIARSAYATLVSDDWRSPINIRDDASTRAHARHIAYAGDRVEVLDREVGGDGYMWYFVRFTVSNATGWVRGDFVAVDGD